ncbi:hypothetical protein IAD21_00308 [Abditibacteriota bacterium]|nr:hypothetical protein IAD21_00308 [Abditibacteriota bacterium]
MSMFHLSLTRDSQLRRIHQFLLLVGLLVADVTTSFSRAQVPGQTTAPKVEKFALLVGITKYDPKKGLTPLEGCLNDVDAMKASLVGNFGFQNDGVHILALKNEAATRRGIIAAFRSQLTANAKKHPNGVFLFYYSGHGSQTFDTNGDEALLAPTDTLDETLVTFDSTRDPKDREHFDLVDDEIQVLYDELQAMPHFSGQLTSIFDCCHSGTATRGSRPLGDQQRRIKGIAADPRRYPEGKDITADSRLHPSSKSSPGLPQLAQFVALSGSMSLETSEERPFPEMVNGHKMMRVHGAMTYYLLQATNEASQKTTNGEMWQYVAQALNRFNQSPQLEGAINQPFLGGGIRSAAPRIIYTREGNTLTISRGVEGGAVKGGVVELFAAQKSLAKGLSKITPSARNSPLGRFQITSADVGRSKIVVPSSFQAPIPVQGTVQLLTPYFGQQPLRVGLGDLSTGPLARRLREFTMGNDFVQLASRGEMADVTLVASTYGEAFPQGRPMEAERHPADECGYFVSVRPGALPLFSAWFKALPDGDISNADEEEIRKTLDNFAAQSNIIALSNASSGAKNLGQAVRLEAFKVPGKMEGDKFVPDPRRTVHLKLDSTGIVHVVDQDRIEFHLSNETDMRVYVSLLWLSQDGGITAIADVDRRKVMVLKPKDEEGATAETAIYRINPPFGCENLKLLVSSQPINAAVFERVRVGRKDSSLFESLLGQALNTRGPIPKNTANLRFDGWSVGDFHLSIDEATSP